MKIRYGGQPIHPKHLKRIPPELKLKEFHRIQTGYGACPPSYTMDPRGSFVEANLAEA